MRNIANTQNDRVEFGRQQMNIFFTSSFDYNACSISLHNFIKLNVSLFYVYAYTKLNLHSNLVDAVDCTQTNLPDKWQVAAGA